MASRNFRELLEARWREGFLVCVGLDTDPGKVPQCVRVDSVEETMFAFNKAIIDATAELVCAFKPQVAFYEAQGPEGIKALIRTNAYLDRHYPEIPRLADAKRADIGNTSTKYATALFDVWLFDGTTLNPYLGRDALQPFLDRREKGYIVVCRSSNPGARDLQDLKVDGGVPLYQKVARLVAAEWNANGNCGVVVGATYPQELVEVRAIIGDMPILIPGGGTQGGQVKDTLLGLNSQKAHYHQLLARGDLCLVRPRLRGGCSQGCSYTAHGDPGLPVGLIRAGLAVPVPLCKSHPVLQKKPPPIPHFTFAPESRLLLS